MTAFEGMTLENIGWRMYLDAASLWTDICGAITSPNS